jgi:hypothetical protein
MKSISIQFAALLLAATTVGAADASVISFQTGYSSAGVQADAAGYQSIVEAAVASPAAGYGSGILSNFDDVTNKGLFGSNGNIAFKSAITFGVDALSSGTWAFRAGVDFGNGGAVFLDGAAVALTTHDMWWDHNYANTGGVFQFSSAIAAGNHTLTLYGLEGCCDGGMQVQYNSGAGFQSFNANTLALQAVPEPETYAMMAAGLGMLGFIARRRRQA